MFSEPVVVSLRTEFCELVGQDILQCDCIVNNEQWCKQRSSAQYQGSFSLLSSWVHYLYSITHQCLSLLCQNFTWRLWMGTLLILHGLRSLQPRAVAVAFTIFFLKCCSCPICPQLMAIRTMANFLWIQQWRYRFNHFVQGKALAAGHYTCEPRMETEGYLP